MVWVRSFVYHLKELVPDCMTEVDANAMRTRTESFI